DPQRQYMLARQAETARTTPRRTLSEHLLHQQLTRLMIDCARPALGAQMNGLDLLLGQELDILAGTLQAQRQVFAGFLLRVGLQLNGVLTLLPRGYGLQPLKQSVFGKKEH